MPFRVLFAVPVVALLAVLGVWYQQRPVISSPVAGATNSVVYVEASINSIDRWEAEPESWGFYRDGFAEISITLETDMLWHSADSAFLTGPEAGSTFMVRTAATGYLEGERYGLYLYPPEAEDQLPLWIGYAHELDTDRPAPAFGDLESSGGQTPADVLDCLVEASHGLTTMEAMREAVVESVANGERSAQLVACERGD